MTTHHQDDLEQAAHTIEEFGRINRVGRTTVYDEIKSGRLRSFKVGRARRITQEAGAEWRKRLEAETADEAKQV